MNNNDEITLEKIAELRRQKAEEARKMGEDISKTARQLFAPAKTTNKFMGAMNLVNNGIAIFDGFMLGMKTIKKVRSLFHR